MENAAVRYADLLSLEGRNFVVLGAGQGMGEQTVAALTQQGAKVLCVDINRELVERVAAAYECHALTANVTVREEVRAVFEQAATLFGGGVHGVVDIVGGVHAKDVKDMDDADWGRQLDLVFKHAALAIQYGAPLLSRSGGGSMVFLGSLAGIRVRSGRMLPYSVAKAALVHLVRGSAKQWAREGVRMNVVAPGLIRTDRLSAINTDPEFWTAQANEIPVGFTGQVSDVVSAVLFFCTKLSRFVTGTVMAVDGGSHLLGESTYQPKPPRP
jgi:NAD(P)-dependent dehydrogenase (short-subunit alcohol dehydrogenase family)